MRFTSTMTALAALCSVAVAAPSCPTSTAVSQSIVRIMALGDSITWSPGCWRAYLWQKLQQAGIKNTDFVGSLPATGCGFNYDGENEGHGGFLATNIANQNLLVNWLSSARPDIVMMHLGTNDAWSNISPDTILGAYSKLVDQMRASKPTTEIIVAKILLMNPPNCADCGSRVVALDSKIDAWAKSKSTSASPITVVDAWTGFNTASMTVDGVHPNDAGAKGLANSWFQPLSNTIKSSA